MIYLLLFISSLWAAETTFNIRSPDQFEEAPNEPPFNTASEDELEPSNEPSAESQKKEFTPRWKQKKVTTPSPQRLEKLNKEKGLFRITKKNEYYYDVKKSPQNHAFSFRFGTLNLSNLVNETAGYSYDDIYGGSTPIILLVDWEWQFFKKMGKLGLKLGSGLSLSQGNGKFQVGSPNDVLGIEPLEQYSFYLLPNSVSAVYRAEYFNKQILVPYAEAGADYFAFAESRDDGDFKYGAAPAWHLAGGVSFLLDWINPQTMITLDKEQGINHIYITAEFRKVFGLNEKFDFTDDIISGGFFIEY